MNKLLITISLLIFSIAQAQECGVIYPDVPVEINLSGPLNTPSAYGPVVFNVFFHIITNDDGTRPTPISENQMLVAIQNLNHQFS